MHTPQRVLRLDNVTKKELALDAFMTIMNALFTDALSHGVMILEAAIMSLTLAINLATAVIKMKIIQMEECYVLAIHVIPHAYLVADHVLLEKHVVGFFQMMCA